MIRKSLVIAVLITVTQIVSAQFFNLPELISLCSSPDMEAANEILKLKNWSLSQSDTTGSDGLDYYTWSYGISNSEYYDEYSAMAPGYLNLISRAGKISGIYYTVFELDLYNNIFNSMKSSGFKKYKGKEFKNDEITTYTDGNLLLLYNIEDINDDENPEASYTAFTTYLLKKPEAGTPGESGPKKEYFPGGELLAEYTLKNGKPDGLVKIYDIKGYAIQESYYRDGLLHGVRKFHYPSVDKNTGIPIEEAGQLYLVSNYTDGEQDGTETWYSHTSYRKFPCEVTDSAGVVKTDTCRQLVITKGKEIINFKKGVLHGMYELYDANGALVQKGKYKNGVETGKWFRKPEAEKSE